MATYYVNPVSGNDSSTGTTTATAWKTFKKATDTVTSGNLIHLLPGIADIAVQCVLASGVSVEGDGSTSVLRSVVTGDTMTAATGYAIKAESVNGSGNQYITNLKMDGSSYTGQGAITFRYRDDVSIYNCWFENFDMFGLNFRFGEPPDSCTNFGHNIRVHDNFITNCGGYYSENSKGDGIHLNGTDGMQIFNNIISTNRPDTRNGNCIGMVEGYNKSLKIYNNKLYHPFYGGFPTNSSTKWDFAIESWNELGDIEIYNNDIVGSVDINRAHRKSAWGAYSYTLWIHDNSIGQTYIADSESTRGVDFEFFNFDCIVERNYIYNVCMGIEHNVERVDASQANIRISYNIFNNICASGTSRSWGTYWGYPPDRVAGVPFNNISVLNNVFIGAGTTQYGIRLPDEASANNITIQNNIVVGFATAPVWGDGTGGSKIDGLSIEKNIFYGNGNSNAPLYVNTLSPTNVSTNNIVGNPSFNTNYTDLRLRSNSPGINAGMNAGLTGTLDFADNVIANPPDIGVYEYIDSSGVFSLRYYSGNNGVHYAYGGFRLY